MSCCTGKQMNSGTAKSVVTSPTVTGYLWPRIGSDGTLNCIAKTDFVDGKLSQAYIDGLINADEPEDRLLPLPEFKNVTNERAESVKQSFDDGSNAKIRDGIRSFSAFLPKSPSKYLGVFEPANCDVYSMILVGECGELAGYTPDDGENFYPLPISQGSMDAMLQWATNANIHGNNIAFEFSRAFTDQQVAIITSEGLDFDSLSLRGLLDVKVSGSSIATQTDLLYVVDYGMEIDQEIFLKSLVDGDVVIINTSQGDAVVVIDTFDVTNADIGEYIAEHAVGVASTDVLRIETTKTGFDIPNLLITTT